MTDKTLRALARDYANGVLDKDAYRKARDSLFNGILSGEISVVANDFRPPMQAQDLNSTFEKTSIQAVPPSKEPRPTTEFVAPPKSEAALETTNTQETSLKLYIVLVAVAVITVLILALVFSVPAEKTTLVATDNAPVSPDEQFPVEVVQNITASELIEEFLNRRDWSEEQLQQFVAHWNNLPPDELAKGLTPPLSIQLANAIYKQLLEERSLFGTVNNDVIIARQQALVDFANALGMDDPRLQVREAPPALPVNEPEPSVQASPDITPASTNGDMQ